MDELQISGKRFISSRRLAREYGYTADYLGQLIRGGKVTGQKVGRAWYVDAASFEHYLGNEVPAAPTLLIEKESVVEPAVEPVQEPAAESQRVTPEKEPEVVEMVEQDKEEKEEEKVPAEAVAEEEPAHHVPLHIIKKEEPIEAEEKSVSGGLRYVADDAPNLPEIRFDKKESRVARPTQEEEGVISPAFVPARSAKVSRAPVLALVGAGAAVFVFCAVVSSALSLNLSIEAGNSASTSYSLDW